MKAVDAAATNRHAYYYTLILLLLLSLLLLLKNACVIIVHLGETIRGKTRAQRLWRTQTKFGRKKTTIIKRQDAQGKVDPREFSAQTALVVTSKVAMNGRQQSTEELYDNNIRTYTAVWFAKHPHPIIFVLRIWFDRHFWTLNNHIYIIEYFMFFVPWRYKLLFFNIENYTFASFEIIFLRILIHLNQNSNELFSSKLLSIMYQGKYYSFWKYDVWDGLNTIEININLSTFYHISIPRISINRK